LGDKHRFLYKHREVSYIWGIVGREGRKRKMGRRVVLMGNHGLLKCDGSRWGV
jgi:hypothetical protein